MTALNIFLGVIGPTEWIMIVIVLVLLFGGKKIPELMKGLGSGIKEFKKAANDTSDDTSKKEEN